MKLWSISKTTLKATLILALTIFYSIIFIDLLPYGILRMISMKDAENYHQYISDNNIHIIIGIIVFTIKTIGTYRKGSK